MGSKGKTPKKQQKESHSSTSKQKEKAHKKRRLSTSEAASSLSSSSSSSSSAASSSSSSSARASSVLAAVDDWPFPKSDLKASFCAVCGGLLDLGGTSLEVICFGCGWKVPVKQLESSEIVTESRIAGAAKKRADNEAQEELTQQKSRAVVDEECPKCKNPKMYFYTMQMRSADEGQTVFYECMKCEHKFSENT